MNILFKLKEIFRRNRSTN